MRQLTMPLMEESSDDVFLPSPDDDGYYITADGNSGVIYDRAPQEKLENWGESDDPTSLTSTKGAKPKKSDHNIRTRDLFVKEGWFVFRVDQYRTNPQTGAIYTVDFLGLFDWMAIKPPNQLVGIQICAKSDIGSHITKMTSTQETSFNRRPKIENLKRWLECGGKVVLVGWEKPGRYWEPTFRKLNLPEVEVALARKRKRAA